MILRPASVINRDNVVKNDYRDYGIYDATRSVLLFVQPEQAENKMIRACHAIIVNECIYDDKSSLTHFIKAAGTHCVKTSVYYGLMIFGVPGNFDTAEFKIDNAVTKEVTFVPNGQWCRHDPARFNVKWGTTSDEINSMRDNVWSSDSIVINPIYYTDYQMHKCSGEYFDLFDQLSGGYGTRIKVRDLFTPECRITYMNVNYWDTYRLSSPNDVISQLDRIYAENKQGGTDSIYCPIMIGSGLENFVANDAIFIYDSDANGKNKRGVNIKDGKIPMKDAYNKQFLGENVRNALVLFEQSCKDHQDKFGPIRVLYSPSNIGDKCKITYKEHYTKLPFTQNNAPPVPLGSYGEGAVDKTSSNIDRGFKSDLDTDEVIDTLTQDMESLFDRQVSGF